MIQHAIWFRCRIVGHLIESLAYALIIVHLRSAVARRQQLSRRAMPRALEVADGHGGEEKLPWSSVDAGKRKRRLLSSSASPRPIPRSSP